MGCRGSGLPHTGIPIQHLAILAKLLITEESYTMAKAEQAVKTVKMDDERIVEFSGRRKMLKDSIFLPDGRIQVRMDFVNGETRTFTLPAALVDKFAAHGAEQKLGDEIAGIDDTDDCIMAIDSLVDRLNLGTMASWLAKRESNGMAGTSVLAKALVEHSGKTIEQIKAFLLGKTQAEKVALRANASIKPIVERLEAEKTTKKVTADIDTVGLLDQLDKGILTLGNVSTEGAAEAPAEAPAEAGDEADAAAE